MSQVLEVVVFTVREGEREAFLSERGSMLAAVRERFAGLLDAQLAEYEDGTWIDVVRWDSLEEAERAAQALSQIEAARTWAAHIDEVRDFRHAAVHHLAHAAVD